MFLFGARQVGKTTYLRSSFPHAVYYDLLSAATFRELSANPELLFQRAGSTDLIIIDEIQSLPALLNEVQRLITAQPEVRCIMTGSSARKLKRGAANLLGGRATERSLWPLVSPELNFERFNDRLTIGGLPQILTSPNPAADLEDYVSLYLQQEIQFEGLVRNIESFARFLPLAALCNGKQINFTEVASDAQVTPHVLREYFQILEDTFVGIMLPAFRGTVKRKAVASAKFYLFDVGVTNTLIRRGVVAPGTEGYGEALEQLLILEVHSYLRYTGAKEPLTYWRSTSKLEVDIVIGDRIAIEIKGKAVVTERDLKGLRALAEELPLQRKIVVANESARRRLDGGIEIIPGADFLRALWGGEIVRDR
jgi:predicted AAA+ superfamily ATPase